MILLMIAYIWWLYKFRCNIIYLNMKAKLVPFLNSGHSDFDRDQIIEHPQTK